MLEVTWMSVTQCSANKRSSISSILSSSIFSFCKIASHSSNNSNISNAGDLLRLFPLRKIRNFLRISLASGSLSNSSPLAFNAYSIDVRLKKLSQTPQKHLIRSWTGFLELPFPPCLLLEDPALKINNFYIN